MQPGTYLPTEYLPVLFMILVATGFGAVTLWIGRYFRLSRPYKEKLIGYESGNPPSEVPRFRFSIKFYLIAILFVVFDVEAIFLYPWALVFDHIGIFAVVEMFLFIFLLLIGYAYAWRKEALEWEE